jgi:hypothetical protein
LSLPLLVSAHEHAVATDVGFSESIEVVDAWQRQRSEASSPFAG